MQRVTYRRRAYWTVAAISALELVLLLLLSDYRSGRLLGGDAPAYARLAQAMLDGRGFSLAPSPPFAPTIARAPGYPAFLAVCSVIVRSAVAVRVLQLALLALTSLAIFELSHLLCFRGATATMSAVLCATYFPLVGATAYHLSEILATALLAVGSALLASGVLRRRLALVCAAGAALGLATLVRPALSILAILCACWVLLAWRSPRRAVGGLLFALGCGVPVLPWIVRNAVVAHEFVGLGTSAAWSRYVSNQQWAGTISFAVTVPEWGTVIAGFNRRQAQAAARMGSSFGPATELLVERSYAADASALQSRLKLPDLAKRLPARIAYLWSPADLTPCPDCRRVAPLLHRMAQVQHLVLGVLVVIGMLSARGALLRLGPLWLPAAYVSALHLYFHVEARYSLPARPLLLVLAAEGLLVLAAWTVSASRHTGGARGAASRSDGRSESENDAQSPAQQA